MFKDIIITLLFIFLFGNSFSQNGVKKAVFGVQVATFADTIKDCLGDNDLEQVVRLSRKKANQLLLVARKHQEVPKPTSVVVKTKNALLVVMKSRFILTLKKKKCRIKISLNNSFSQQACEVTSKGNLVAVYFLENEKWTLNFGEPCAKVTKILVKVPGRYNEKYYKNGIKTEMKKLHDGELWHKIVKTKKTHIAGSIVNKFEVNARTTMQCNGDTVEISKSITGLNVLLVRLYPYGKELILISTDEKTYCYHKDGQTTTVGFEALSYDPKATWEKYVKEDFKMLVKKKNVKTSNPNEEFLKFLKKQY